MARFGRSQAFRPILPVLFSAPAGGGSVGLDVLAVIVNPPWQIPPAWWLRSMHPSRMPTFSDPTYQWNTLTPGAYQSWDQLHQPHPPAFWRQTIKAAAMPFQSDDGAAFYFSQLFPVPDVLPQSPDLPNRHAQPCAEFTDGEYPLIPAAELITPEAPFVYQQQRPNYRQPRNIHAPEWPIYSLLDFPFIEATWTSQQPGPVYPARARLAAPEWPPSELIPPGVFLSFDPWGSAVGPTRRIPRQTHGHSVGPVQVVTTEQAWLIAEFGQDQKPFVVARRLPSDPTQRITPITDDATVSFLGQDPGPARKQPQPGRTPDYTPTMQGETLAFISFNVLAVLPARRVAGGSPTPAPGVFFPLVDDITFFGELRQQEQKPMVPLRALPRQQPDLTPQPIDYMQSQALLGWSQPGPVYPQREPPRVFESYIPGSTIEDPTTVGWLFVQPPTEPILPQRVRPVSALEQPRLPDADMVLYLGWNEPGTSPPLPVKMKPRADESRPLPLPTSPDFPWGYAVDPQRPLAAFRLRQDGGQWLVMWQTFQFDYTTSWAHQQIRPNFPSLARRVEAIGPVPQTDPQIQPPETWICPRPPAVKAPEPIYTDGNDYPPWLNFIAIPGPFIVTAGTIFTPGAVAGDILGS